uniref:Gamma-tubulin complex component n=1 Tax=Cyprinus carpio TaxID=7962 RepID=A0A8C1LVH5_CYPCA
SRDISHLNLESSEWLTEKLMVHSDLSKAESWSRLTEEFLSSPLPDTEGTETDVHYGVLALLLHLSDSPSNTNYCERPRLKESEKEDKFDWAKYLMEEYHRSFIWQEWSEDESEEEDSLQPLSREDSGIQVDRTPQEDHEQNDKTVQVTQGHTICSFLPLLKLFSGVKKLFIFQHNDGKVTVRNDVVVTHLTNNCLHSVLEHIAAYGQAVSRLQKFIVEVTGHSADPCPPSLNSSSSSSSSKKSSDPPFRTYQAFVWALYKYFTSFKEELNTIEKDITAKDETVTLSSVLERLSPPLAQITMLHKVFCTGVADVPPGMPNVLRASHLLNTLYKAIIEYDSVGEASEQSGDFLFAITTVCIHIILLIIHLNKDVPVNHRDFCEERLSDAASGSSGGEQVSSSRQHTMVSFLAGKSMQLLRNLDCKETEQPDDAKRKSLYTLFLESVQTRLWHGEESPMNMVTEQQATKKSLIRMQSIVARHLELDDIHDPLLAINFARLYLEQNDFHEKFSSSDVILDRFSESVTCQTFELMLRSCLYPHIERRYIECCGNLMRTLKKDYRLLGYLQAMRNYFLLEAGDTMYDFYTAIFEKVLEKESWQQLAFLNVQLQEAVGQRHPEDSNQLSIFLETIDPARKKQPVNNLDGHKVPWPVDIVISSECQKIYNQVFLLLLQIKWAKYSLDTLRYFLAAKRQEVGQFEESTAKEPINQQIHRMFLLRVKLMHFVNSLHNYIMTRILHSTGLEFQHQVQEAKDLDQLIKIHYRYLSTIHDRCLLREKVSFVKEAIMKVLNLVLIFSDIWQAGLGAWKIKSIDKIESDFKNCHMFLVTILNKAVCRGSFPHLECLVLSLVAGFEQC